jgi:hypothetical protein
MRSSGAIQGVKTSGPEIALRWALRWHVWRPRTRLRLIRVLLSLEPVPDPGSEAHRPASLRAHAPAPGGRINGEPNGDWT